MIKIQKENDIKLVTQGAYREYYEHLGYEIINERKPLEKKEVEKKIETKTDKTDNGRYVPAIYLEDEKIHSEY